MSDDATALPGDTKDWTWVLERRCDECGLLSAELEPSDLAGLLHDTALEFGDALRGPRATERPDEQTWSVLEYACHVRDVHRVFAERLSAMLTQDSPQFENWDQDAAAVEGDYASQDPAQVDVELVEAAGHVAGLYASVPAEHYAREGRRSNGSLFTVRTLAQYHLHDVLHHVHDITKGTPAADPG